MATVIDAALAGDYATARAAHYKLFPVMSAMFLETNPVPAKKSLELMGKIKSGAPRLPLAEMTEGNLAKLKIVLSAYGLI